MPRHLPCTPETSRSAAFCAQIHPPPTDHGSWVLVSARKAHEPISPCDHGYHREPQVRKSGVIDGGVRSLVLGFSDPGTAQESETATRTCVCQCQGLAKRPPTTQIARNNPFADQ